MGLRVRPRTFDKQRRKTRFAASRLKHAFLAAGLALLGGALPALAAAPAPAAAAADARPKDRLLLEAKQLIYNRDKNVVTAEGDVRLYYQGRSLVADKVVYDRNTNRVFATGNAKLTEADGTVSYSDLFDLTDDFKDGFIDSLKADTKDKTHITAARAERTGGESTTFDKALYSACDACKDDPTRPPLWQVRAKKIIHKNQEHTVYYEDAYLEFYGYPVAYLPYFSTPDSNTGRKSGVLTPHYIFKTALGYGLTVPYFFALAPNYDVTVSPTYYSRQGFFGDVEWRHRLLNGSYSIRAAGIFQQDTTAFTAVPFGAGPRAFRGSVESNGLFNINERWKFGWKANIATDKYFQTDYKEPTANLTNNYFPESISTAFLTGQAARGYFDLRGYYIRGQSANDFQRQQPVVLPVLDYNKTFDIKPGQSGGIGGQVEVDLNVISLTRAAAAYQATGARTLDSTFGIYDICATATKASAYVHGGNTGNCLLRGIGGDYTRATLNLSWKRKYIDPVGQVWTPFAFAHVNGEWLDLDTSRSYNIANASGTLLSNSFQPSFLGGNPQNASAEVLPGAGLEYRYPFLAQTSWATHVFEPIGQIIVRPAEIAGRALVNEDAQSLVFDDTTLFEWSKYSGYDRFEGGIRANAGAQYTMNFTSGGYANILAGQSFQIAGRNSYATADAANTGLGSGLESARSDYVARAAVSTGGAWSFIAKGRFDPDNYALRRVDLSANANFGGLTTSVQYARYTAQPEIGFDKRREGLSASARYKFLDRYFVEGNVVFNLSRYLYNGAGVNVGRFSVASAGLGIGYDDECTSFSVRYASTYSDASSTVRNRNQTVMVELKLRTLGDAKVRTSLGASNAGDGL